MLLSYDMREMIISTSNAMKVITENKLAVHRACKYSIIILTLCYVVTFGGEWVCIRIEKRLMGVSGVADSHPPGRVIG